MVKINDFRQLCQSWINAPTQQKADAIADKIDYEIATASHVRWAELHRTVSDLPLTFQHVSYGMILDRSKHPKLPHKSKPTGNIGNTSDNKEEINA
ncbi:MAG: hypothetical protein V1719_01630 [Patescibacteria group bacterium]